ncbi:MAG TPA: T9SS type B sorting domain-containing protein [Leeuwenhoekiella sp.]|nr:T9SS type B sorting domain-containing protein [Leeuwenhoekiella sp.]
MQNYNVVNQQIGALKFFFMVLFFLSSIQGFSQTVSVNNSQSAESLVEMLLNDACAEVSNSSSSSVEATGSFSNNGGAFPIADGVIIRTGNAGFTSGGYTGDNIDSELNTDSDVFLQDLLDRSGRDAIIEETAFLEFNFVPVSNFLSFDFLLASNEYGAEQCNSSDVLAFVLTDLQTGTETNLGVLPGGNTPVSVQNIKDNTYNPVCPSTNADLFASYEVENTQSTVNMRGYTSVLTAASSSLVPGREYKMRIVIGDANDSRFDSAIFLSAGSFDTGVNLGPDFSLCGGDGTVLESGLTGNGYTFRWFKDDVVIGGQNGNTLAIGESGTYRVEVTRSDSNCLLEDEIVVSDLNVTQPQDLSACYSNNGNGNFDLTENDAAALGITDEGYDILYYESQNAVNNGNPLPTNQLTAYTSTGNQNIFIKLRNTETGIFCDAQYTFQLNVSEPINVQAPAPIDICVLPGEDGMVDLSASMPVFSGGEDPADYEVTYYSARRNAQDASDPIDITVPYTVPQGTTTRTIYIRVALTAQPACYEVISFPIRVGDLPLVEEIEDVVACGSYTLPPLTNGNYFSQPGGQGTLLNAGDVLDVEFTQTIYIYNESADGCPSAPSSFTVTLPDKFILENTSGCESKYTLPALPQDAGAFYTQPGGGGNMFVKGAALSRSQTIYYYAEVNGSICVDTSFDVELDPLPAVDDPDDEIVCVSYELPPLTDGIYNTQANGQGTTLAEGTIIESTQTIYTFAQDDNCSNQKALNIFIVPTYDYFADPDGQGLSVCGSFDLPEITKGAYYTQALGQGDTIPRNETLLQSQTVYYFVQTTTGPNCTNDLSFDVEVKPIPEVDSLDNLILCAGETFTLPELDNGQYFTAPNRGGAQLAAGDVIGETQTIYISNLVNGCESDPSEFTVTIRPLPPLDNFVSIYACDVYELPVLDNGSYYTETGGPNGLGEELDAGTLIDTTTTLYLYNRYDDLTYCENEREFTINILGVEVGEFDDVTACDAYILPELANGDYYSAPRGRGRQLNAGDRIVETQQLYVYSRKGTRFICEDEATFTVTISETPFIEPTNDVEQCGSYTLPTLDQTEFNFGYYRSPNGQDPISPSEYLLDQPGTYAIYRYATAKNNTACFDEDIFLVTIYPLLDFSVAGGTICTDAMTGEVLQPITLESGLDPAEFEVSWTLNGEVVDVGSTHEATAAGIYTVTTEKLNPEVGAACNYNATTVEVLASSQPNIEAEVNQPFADVSVVTVRVVNGDGDYEYQIDGGEFQSSNEFYDVQSGTHEVTARGITGNCDATTIIVNVINYQKFFTPNADGYNDVWNIDSLQDYQDAQILIFDRYGKLLKTIFPKGNGWDGTFRGENMPSDDYWFKVSFVDEEGMPVEFKAHFTLKR